MSKRRGGRRQTGRQRRQSRQAKQRYRDTMRPDDPVPFFTEYEDDDRYETASWDVEEPETP